MTEHVNTRELILGILLSVTEEGTYSHIALAGVLDKYQYLEKKERAFITRVVEGTLEQLIRMDYIINTFSKVPVKKMKPVIRGILRSGAYQICCMSVPDAAVCNESVRLAAKRGFHNLKGFVNGVLRNISREKDRITYPDPETEWVRYLSVTYSVPEWMILLWQQDFSYDWARKEDRLAMEEMLSALLIPAPFTVRANRQQCTPKQLKQALEEEGVCVEQDEELPCAFHISGFDYLGGLSCFQKGWFYVQDTSSMQVAQTASPKPGDKIVDVCAAPGGKAVHLADMLGGTGEVLARDLTEKKAALIQDNIARCRLSNIKAEVWDATVPDARLEGWADIVVADLPCSGLGVLRRKKDIRYNMTAEMMAELVRLQRRILQTVCRYVKPGGKLVYSTCTVHRAENEENMEWFLSSHPQFRLESQKQLLPGAHSGDGFYIALLRRAGEE